MDSQVQSILQKTAEYIGMTQNVLDKHNEKQSAFQKRAHQVAGVLANKGLISHDAVNAFADKIAADESGTQVWDLVEKLADAIPTDNLGGIAKLGASGKQLDAFERLALYGDPNADTRQSGMVD